VLFSGAVACVLQTNTPEESTPVTQDNNETKTQQQQKTNNKDTDQASGGKPKEPFAQLQRYPLVVDLVFRCCLARLKVHFVNFHWAFYCCLAHQTHIKKPTSTQATAPEKSTPVEQDNNKTPNENSQNEPSSWFFYMGLTNNIILCYWGAFFRGIRLLSYSVILLLLIWCFVVVLLA
jgi:hypothetical protein